MPVSAEIKTLGVEDAIELAGYVEDPEGKYKFPDGTRFNLTKNKSNRRLKEKRYLRYCNAMLSGNWHVTLQSLTFDSKRQIVSGAHRLVALIYADHLIHTDPSYANSLGWNGKQPVMQDTLLGYGVRGKATDCTDTGDSRSLDDVFYRAQSLFPKESESARIRLSRELAVAVRLFYLRSTGQTVAGGEKLEHWKSTTILEENGVLLNCLQMVYELDSTKDEKRRISGRITLGYAAAITYLACHRSGKFLKKDFQMMESFWKSFADNLHEKGNTIRSLWNILTESRSRVGTVLSRDDLVSVTVRAIKHWMENEVSALTTKQLLRALDHTKDRFEGVDSEWGDGFEPVTESTETVYEEVEEEEVAS